VRLFLAINLPEELRRATYEAAAPLRAAAPEARWVREEKLHLTLKFLGDVPEERVGELDAAFGAVAAAHRVVTLEVARFGAFPNWRRPRVVWAGVVPDPRLELLEHDVELAGERLGFPVEGRPFRPHVTIGRLRGPLPDEGRQALAAAARGARLRGSFVAGSLDLMHSDLSTRGAAYRRIAAHPFTAFAPLRSV
jgi:RNA 2',3'-cyclic 3'-phosphodiesterase